MQSLNLHWHKDQYNLFWCRFNNNILKHPGLERQLSGCNFYVRGPYIIFAGINNHTTVYVGSGYVKQRFREHLKEIALWTEKYGSLYVTWADTLFPIALKSYGITQSIYKPNTTDVLRGIEKYLGDRLDPKESERLPRSVDYVIVNLPEWGQSENPFLRSNNYKPYNSTSNRFESVHNLFEQIEKQRIDSQLSKLLAMRAPIKSRWK